MTDKTRLFKLYMENDPYAQYWQQHPAVVQFKKRFHDEQPSLAQLIRLGKHGTAPSLVLEDKAKKALVMALSPRCTSQTREELHLKLSRTLGLLPHFWWSGHLYFDVDRVGDVIVTYKDRGDPKNELREMRTCVLRS